MIKVLKNRSKENVFGFFRGKEVYFGGRKSQKFDMENEEEKAKYDYWRKTFGFIEDITALYPNLNGGGTE